MELEDLTKNQEQPQNLGGMTVFPNQNHNYYQLENHPQNNMIFQGQNNAYGGAPYNMNTMMSQNYQYPGQVQQFNQQLNYNSQNVGLSDPNADPSQGYFRDPRQNATRGGNAGDNIACLKFCGNFCNILCFCCNMCCDKNTITISLGSAGILMEQGEFKKILPPGFYYYNNCLNNIIVVSLKTKTMDLYGASLLTSDNMSISLHIVIGYKIVDPYLATFAVDDPAMVIRDISLGLIKRVIGGYKFQEILHSQEKITSDFRAKLEKVLRKAGLIVPFADLTEINIPQSMVNTMATSAISNREAAAKQLIAESEKQSSMMLKKAGEIMGKNKDSVSLMYINTLKKISDYNNETIIMPDGMIYGLGQKEED